MRTDDKVRMLRDANNIVLSLQLGLMKAEREAVCCVYPPNWRNETRTLTLDERVLFVAGLRHMGLSEGQRVQVMLQFNAHGVLAARLEAGKLVQETFKPLLENTY